MKKRICFIVPVLLLLSFLCFTAGSAEEVSAKPLQLNRQNSVSIKENGGFGYFSFMPDETGIYLFSSGGSGTTVFLYDEDMSQYADGDAECICELEGGKQYYCSARFQRYDKKGTIQVKVTKVNFGWTLEDGVLTISGKCPIPDFGKRPVPWHDRSEEITAVAMEEGITRFRMDDFAGLENLESISIPASVNRLDSSSSIGYVHRRLKNIEVAARNKAYTSEDGVLFDKKKTELLLYPAGKTETSYTVPDKVSEIYVYAFKGSHLEKVILPDSLKSINVGAFEESALTSILIPAKVSYIYNNPFMGCDRLTEITVSEKNGVFVSRDGILYSREKNELLAYPAGKPEASFTVPKTTEKIEGNAFSTCMNLTSVTIPNTVTLVRSDIFNYCANLQDVYYEGTKAEWNKLSNGEGDPFRYFSMFGTLHCADTPVSGDNPAAETGNPPRELFGRKIPKFPKWMEPDRCVVQGDTLTITMPRTMENMWLSEIDTDQSVSGMDRKTISMKIQDPSHAFALTTLYSSQNPGMQRYNLWMYYRFEIRDGVLVETEGSAQYDLYDSPEFWENGITCYYDRQADISSLVDRQGEKDGETTVLRQFDYSLLKTGWRGEFITVRSAEQGDGYLNHFCAYSQNLSDKPFSLSWGTTWCERYWSPLDLDFHDEVDVYKLNVYLSAEEDRYGYRQEIHELYPETKEDIPYQYGVISHSEDTDDQGYRNDITLFAYPEDEPLLIWQGDRLILSPEVRDLNGNPLPIPELPDLSVLEKLF